MKNVALIALAAMFASCGGGGSSSGADSSTAPGHPDGKTVFINNCVQCHAINQDKNGPKLAGAISRWNNDTARLASYIRNSQEAIKTDPYAAKLYAQWSNMVMPAFNHLTEEEIKQVIAYIAEGKD
ncbi:MAG: cytochrome c [Flavipsychrobacter sp.]|nr:cytochrome c [Flavipsychrobacter sp.]